MRARGRKNAAGGWLLGEVYGRITGIALAAAVVVGFALGLMAAGFPLIGRLMQAHPGWLTPGGLVVAGLAFGLAWLALHRTDATWGQGLAAERRVGDRIEHALIRHGCAFAHDVKEALDSACGNVDHVVLTSAGVWVVETKAAWLEEGPFQDALRQTAANVKRVRRKLDRPDVPVRAALVIADNREPYEADFDWDGEPVTAFRVVSFWRRLQEECDEGEGASRICNTEELSRAVWNLGSSQHLDP